MLKICRSNELSSQESHDFWLLALSACRSDGNALGWLPTRAYEERHSAGEIHTIFRNSDCVGYCLWAIVAKVLHVYSCWIRPDARMIEHGRQLIRRVEATGRARGANAIRLWCAEDLPANAFWRQLEFEALNWRHGGIEKGRRHIQWRRPIMLPITAERKQGDELKLTQSSDLRDQLHERTTSEHFHPLQPTADRKVLLLRPRETSQQCSGA